MISVPKHDILAGLKLLKIAFLFRAGVFDISDRQKLEKKSNIAGASAMGRKKNSGLVPFNIKSKLDILSVTQYS